MKLMSAYIKELKKEIDELEWRGDYTQADRVKRELDIAERKYHAGELYEPDF